jgi:hypothetical protein
MFKEIFNISLKYIFIDFLTNEVIIFLNEIVVIYHVKLPF